MYKCRTKITTHRQGFGHVNATNCNSYFNIICTNLYISEKKIKKTKIQTFLVFSFFLNWKPKILPFCDFQFF